MAWFDAHFGKKGNFLKTFWPSIIKKCHGLKALANFFHSLTRPKLDGEVGITIYVDFLTIFHRKVQQIQQYLASSTRFDNSQFWPYWYGVDMFMTTLGTQPTLGPVFCFKTLLHDQFLELFLLCNFRKRTKQVIRLGWEYLAELEISGGSTWQWHTAWKRNIWENQYKTSHYWSHAVVLFTPCVEQCTIQG